MKVSCLPVSLFKQICSRSMSIRQWANISKQCDLDSIDISIIFLENHTPAYLNRIKNDLEEEQVTITMATTYPDFTHQNKIQRERELEYLRNDIAICSQLNIKYLRVLAGQAHPNIKIEDGLNWAIENLILSSVTADKFGVQLLYEDHAKPGAWDFIDFSHPTDLFLKICEGIKDTSIKINFDTGNIVAYGDDPIPVLNKLINRIETIHVSDTEKYGVFNPVVIGTGAVPNQEIFGILKKCGFDGWLCIEEASNTGVEGISRAVQYVRDAWRKA